jgi:hypothetical protein
MKMNEPTNCEKCQTSLERGYASIYQNDNLIRCICFKCDDEEVFQNYLKDKKLTTKLTMHNTMVLYDFNGRDAIREKNIFLLEELKHRIDIQLATTKIQLKLKEFEKKVWFNGLQNKVNASKARGLSAKPKGNDLDNFCVLVYSMAGRVMITIEDDHCSVTAITSDTGSESCMGLQGVCATEEEALSIITMAIDYYDHKCLDFKEDKKISMGF